MIWYIISFAQDSHWVPPLVRVASPRLFNPGLHSPGTVRAIGAGADVSALLALA